MSKNNKLSPGERAEMDALSARFLAARRWHSAAIVRLDAAFSGQRGEITAAPPHRRAHLLQMARMILEKFTGDIPATVFEPASAQPGDAKQEGTDG